MAIKRIEGPVGAIHVDDGGRGVPAVVFLHSFAGSSAHFSSQLLHLRPSRRAVAFDLRGHGQSGLPENGDYAVESMAEDVGVVLDALKIKKCVLVGHSLGGAVAIEYAGAHPERVVGLVLAATPGKTPEDLAQKVLASLRSDYKNVMEDYWDKLLMHAQPQTISQLRKGMESISTDAAMTIIQSTFEFDPISPLKKYQGPKLVIVPQQGETPYDLHKVLPDLQYNVMTGTSHWMHMDRPADFNLLLDDFLQTLGTKKSVPVGNSSAHVPDPSEQIQQMLERLGNAISSANAKAVAACWEPPALILSDHGASVFSDARKIEQMFGKAIAWYRAQGLTKTKPEVERIERLSETLAEVDVRWPAFNDAGDEKASERSLYIVHMSEDGQVRIQVALTRTERLLAA